MGQFERAPSPRNHGAKIEEDFRSNIQKDMQEGGHVVLSPISFEEFPVEEEYSAFENLPSYAQKALRRMTYSAKRYLSGFLMQDMRTTEDRDKWEKGMQEKYGAVFNSLYAGSKLRRNAMTMVVSPLSLAADSASIVHANTPEHGELLRLDREVPPNIIAPYQKEVFDPVDHVMRHEPVTRYEELTLPEKLAVVHKIEDIALEYLELITRQEDKEKLADIRRRITGARADERLEVSG